MIMAMSQRKSEMVANAIQHQIVAEKLRPGTCLPTEAELVARFGVSRTAVREATRLLVQRGLVDVAPRRGMSVAALDPTVLQHDFQLLLDRGAGSFAHLMELRQAIETQIAADTVNNSSPESLQALRQSQAAAVEQTHAAPVTRENFLEADMGFHDALAATSANPLLRHLAMAVNAYLRTHYAVRAGYPSDPVRTVEEHAAILRSIEERDTLAVQESIRHHLMRLREKWRNHPTGPDESA